MTMLTLFQSLGRATLGALQKLGRSQIFLLHVLMGLPLLITRPRLLLKEVYTVGVLTILLISVSGLFVGMVLALQGYNVLSDFGEQLAGMEMMAVDPLKRTIAPRFFAGVLSMPLLVGLFTAVGVIGGYFIGVGLLGVDQGPFWSQMQAKIDFEDDALNGLIKSLVFGVIVTWIAVFEGYDAVPTAEGVSRATTRSVVYSAFAVLGSDFLLTALMFGD